jgi:hypothetical protein
MGRVAETGRVVLEAYRGPALLGARPGTLPASREDGRGAGIRCVASRTLHLGSAADARTDGSKDNFAQYLQSLAITGVKSISLALEQMHVQPLHMSRISIEGLASWTHRYNGFVVTLRGRLSVVLQLQPIGQPDQQPTWTIDSFTFESECANYSILKEAVTSADDMTPAFLPAKDDPALSPICPLEPGRLQPQAPTATP